MEGSLSSGAQRNSQESRASALGEESEREEGVRKLAVRQVVGSHQVENSATCELASERAVCDGEKIMKIVIRLVRNETGLKEKRPRLRHRGG